LLVASSIALSYIEIDTKQVRLRANTGVHTVALVAITVQISDTHKNEFESFLKALPTAQQPVAGDRLFRLAQAQDKQRKSNLDRNKTMREAVRIAKEKGLLPGLSAPKS
jgi:uncharacterized protein YbcC (UPF0753/DUF2309 family)